MVYHKIIIYTALGNNVRLQPTDCMPHKTKLQKIIIRFIAELAINAHYAEAFKTVNIMTQSGPYA